jgi:hypothetical protein
MVNRDKGNLQSFIVWDGENKRHHRFLRWFGHKRVLVATLLGMFTVVGCLFVLYTYQWLLTSISDKRVAVSSVQKPAARIILFADQQQFTLPLEEIGFNGSDIHTIDKWELGLWLDQVKKKVNISSKQKSSSGDGKQTWIVDEQQLMQWLSNPELIINKPQMIRLVPQKQPQVTPIKANS